MDGGVDDMPNFVNVNGEANKGLPPQVAAAFEKRREALGILRDEHPDICTKLIQYFPICSEGRPELQGSNMLPYVIDYLRQVNGYQSAKRDEQAEKIACAGLYAIACEDLTLATAHNKYPFLVTAVERAFPDYPIPVLAT